MFQRREIDDDAAVRVAERVEEGAGRRRRLFAAEDSDTGQRVERPLITLRVDDTEAIAVKNQALAEQSSQP